MGAAQSSLLEAAASGDARRVRELLSAGKDGAAVAAATEEHGWSWLHIAAFKGHAAVVKEAASVPGGPTAVLELRDKRGRTPLHLAASENRPEAAASLLAAGASAGAADANGLLPIHKAAYAGAAATLRVLTTGPAAATHINAALRDGMTPLHLAAWKGSADSVTVLLLAGASCMARNDRGGTALHEAAAGGSLEVIGVLLQGPGKRAAKVRDAAGRSPAELAAQAGHKQAAQQLRAAEQDGLLGFLGRKLGLAADGAGGNWRGAQVGDQEEEEDGGWGEAVQTDWASEPVAPAAPPESASAAPPGSSVAGDRTGLRGLPPLQMEAGEDEGAWGDVEVKEDGWGSPAGSPRPSGGRQHGDRADETHTGPGLQGWAPSPSAVAGAHPLGGRGLPAPAPDSRLPERRPPASSDCPMEGSKEGYEEGCPSLPPLPVTPERDALVAAQAQEIEELRRLLAANRLASGSSQPQPPRPLSAAPSSAATCQMYSMHELQEATSNFALENRIGTGGYGEVFRGVLRSHTAVAVKRLHPDSLQGAESLWREVGVLSQVRHPHIVLLLGACPEGGCLVYELMEGGSLEDALSRAGAAPPSPLSWQDRVRIALEMSTALLVLHQAHPQPVFHRDFKPANVLLDAHRGAKLADVGLARLAYEMGGGANRTHVQDTSPVGTLDYIDPEYLHTGRFGPSSDTYSLGVSLLQLMTGRLPRGKDGRTLHDWVASLLRAGLIHDALDPAASRGGSSWPLEDARMLAELALQCCAYNRADRPPLAQVVVALKRLASSAEDKAQARATKKSREPPSMFICPITQELMENPVVAADGYSYEGSAIEEWLRSGHSSSPMTNAPLAHQQLTPNFTMRSAIAQWKQAELGEALQP
mmetsp:Transcript_14225/g.35936  ORF Transcript_14225/g.35936 Transcript_14225/m.35936 type:complete len:872 (-) Transcript_14225:361-2976(-)